MARPKPPVPTRAPAQAPPPRKKKRRNQTSPVGILLVVSAAACVALVLYVVSAPVTEVTIDRPPEPVADQNYPIITITPTPPPDTPALEAVDDGPKLPPHQASLLAMGEEQAAKKLSASAVATRRHGILVWPTRDTKVNSGFGYRTNPVSGRANQLHRGIDVRAPCGTGVLAAGEGVVIFADWTDTSGNTVKIKHGNLTTRYAHLSQLNTKRGARVRAGQLIGLSGDTGRQSTGPHLHFEIWKNGAPKNPLSFKFRYLPNRHVARAGMSCGSSPRAPVENVASQKEPRPTDGNDVDEVLKSYGEVIGK